MKSCLSSVFFSKKNFSSTSGAVRGLKKKKEEEAAPPVMQSYTKRGLTITLTTSHYS
jgi:hypothetical protein